MSEQQKAWASFARRFGLALTLFALLPLGFLPAYIFVFDAPGSAVVPHLYFLSGLCAGWLGLRLVLRVTIGARWATAASAALVAVATLATLLFYGLALIGLQHWGRVISVDLIRAYIPQTGELLRALGYSSWVAAAALATLIILVSLAAFAFLRKLDWVTPLSAAISRPVAGVVGLVLISIAAVSAAELPHRDWGYRSEPVSLSLFPERGETGFKAPNPGGQRAKQLDRAQDSARAAYRPNGAARRSNVILIVADALRHDHLALFGYPRPTTPHLEMLAQQGRVRLASSAVAVCNESACGLHAIAGSRYMDAQSRRQITLQEVLKLHDYGVHFVLSGDHTSFYGLREAYGPATSYFDGASQKARYVNDDRVVLDGLRALPPFGGQPTMLQVHLMSTHGLGTRFEDTPGFGPEENYVGPGDKDVQAQQRAVNFYDRGVLQADRMVREILDRLQAGGYLQDALVVITGDHGEFLGEHGRYTHGKGVWEPGLRVPFVLLAFGHAEPGPLQAGSVVSQVDIAPTLLRALDMPIPSTWEGQPLQEPARARAVYFQQGAYIGLVDTRTPGRLYKHWLGPRKGESFTFDLSQDPAEQHELTPSIPEALRNEWLALLLSRSSALDTGAADDQHVRRH